MILIELSNGLANRMRVIASGLWLQNKLNCKLICFWPEDYYLNAPYNLLFEDIDGLIIQPKSKKYKYIKSTNQENFYKKIAAAIINKFAGVDYCIRNSDFAKLIRNNKIDIFEIAQKNKNIYLQTCEEFGENYSEFQKFKPINSILQKINSIAKRFNKNTIGLHIRRTDNHRSIEISPLELFVEKINYEINQNNDINFFLSTDDSNLEKELIDKFGNRIITHKKEYSRQTIAGMQDAVVDMYCLSKTSLIYGSYWSSFSDIAGRIGKIKSIAIKNEK